MNIWFKQYAVYYADKPQAPKPLKPQAPKPQTPRPQAPKPQTQAQGGKQPSKSLIQNAVKFFNKNPSRINNPPDAYKSVVANKYITNKNGTWTSSGRPDIGKMSTTGGKNWSGTPTQSRIENAAKFFAKYPDRVNDPPAAYKGLIEAGYVKQTGTKFSANPTPLGQAPARPLGSGGSNGGSSGNSGGGSGSGSGGWGKGRLPPSNPLPTGVTNATSSTFCANSFTPGGQYPGVKNCSGGRAATAKYVEDDPNNSTAAATFAASAKANPDAIRAAYVPTGSASGSLRNVPTNNNGCQSYLKGNGGGCIDWSNPSAANQALGIIKGNIDKAYATGANAIRLDENDVCETNNGGARSCQGAYGKAMQEVSRYAASKGMGIMGNNSPTTQKALVEAQQSGGATVVGSMLDSSSQYMKDNINEMQSAIGNNIPIYTVQS